uniref:Holo-[acyl-carrier-protein] synthase n=1 Tax=candidate division WOR-3 bacterium TaxID=2052148 RepID=A0A7C4THB7_UNCW3
MEILGVGIDIIEVARIEKAINNRKTFLNKIYSEKEIKLSARGKFRYEELAGRFVVKEAVLKVLKTGWRRGIRFRDIIVLNESSGAPFVVLENRAKEIADELGIKKIFISISHTKELAIGIAIAIR